MVKEEVHPQMVSDPPHKHSEQTKMQEEKEEDLQEGDAWGDHHKNHHKNHWVDCQVETTIIEIGMTSMGTKKAVV